MSDQNVEVVKEFTRLFDAGDREMWRRYFHPDVIWDMSASVQLMSGVYRGYEGVERFFVDWLSTWEDYEVQHREWIDAGDSVVVAFRQRGRGRGSGVVVEQDYFGVYDLREGKVARYRHFESREGALQAAGVDLT